MKKKIYQLGTVMPGMQPVQFQYRPMGLEAFSQPLAMMQDRYDKTFDAIDEAEFEIKNLNPDTQSAEKLKGEMEEHKAALLSELERTGNFREASRKIRKLNEIYTKDPEITGIRTQRANWLEADKEMRDRIDGKKYTQDDYEKWAFKNLGEYAENQGYSYDRATGRHNSINTDLRGANLEAEVMDLAYKAAHDTPLQIEEFFRQNGYTTDPNNPELQTLQETLVKSRDRNQVATEVANFLRQSDRYKTWLEEKADYDWYYDSRTSGDIEKFAEDEIKAQFERLSDSQDYYSKVLATPNISDEIKAQATVGLKDANEDVDEFSKVYQNAIINGTVSQLGEATYKYNRVKGFYGNTANAASDLFDTQQITQNLHTRTDPAAKAASEKLDKIDGMEVNVAARSADPSEAGVWTGSGTGMTGATSDDEVFQKRQKELTADMAVPHKEGAEVVAFNGLKQRMKADGLLDNEGKTGFEGLYSSAQGYHTLWARQDKWDKEIGNMSAKVVELTKDLSKGTVEERQFKRDKLRGLQQDIVEAKISREAEFHYFDVLFKEAAADKENPDADWIREMYAQDASLRDIFKAAYDKDVAKLEQIRDETVATSPHVEEYQEWDEESQSFVTKHRPKLYDPDSPEGIQMRINGTYDLGAGRTGLYPTFSANTTLHSNILEKYRNVAGRKVSAMPIEVIINDQAHAFLGGGDAANSALKGLIDHMKNQDPGTSGAGTVVKFNNTTGEVKRLTDTKTASHLHYNLKYYNEPIFVGTSQEGTFQGNRDVQVLRFTRPSFKNKNEENGWIRRQIAKHSTNADGKAMKPEEVTSKQIKSFKKDNPAELYIAMDHTSFDVAGNAEKTFTEFGEAAMSQNNSYKFEQVLNSYVAFDLTTNSDRRQDYNAMTKRVQNMLRDQVVGDRVSQPPAIWSDNGDGTSSGFSVDYEYDPTMGRIMANVKRITLNNEVDYTKNPLPTAEDMWSVPMDQITAQTLRAIDIIYGVGDERDIVRNVQRDGRPAWVPAAANPNMFYNMANKY